ncbi:MAG: DUF5060 domain-containing protein [bacterium]
MGHCPRAGSLLIAIAAAATGRAAPVAEVSGELRKWHKVTVTFAGPATRESATPNPFRDYRLSVAFAQGERRFVVPGYYAADGDAANSGAEAGRAWRVHFAPPWEGKWEFATSFRAGPEVALTSAPDAGEAAAFDGARGSFVVGPTDKTGRDFRAKGLLRYVGKHHLQFAETGDFFLKGGADSPENLLAYFEFDGTYRHGKAGGRRRGEATVEALHRYQPHARDWRPGDPTWRGGKGKNIIGALNYLAAQGMNSVYFLTMNVGGDGKDVWPWTSHRQRFRFDCSKLDQWEVVFSHMDRLGILLHVVTQETENDQLLDGGELGPQRKLYYRELVARFAHHPAITWNLGEENTNSDAQRQAFAAYIRRLDPYDHPIVCHTFPGRYDRVYTPLLGHPHFEGPSLQTNATHEQTIRWLDRSEASGRPWVVCLDEIGPAHTGVKPDSHDPDHDAVRKKHLWGNLMAGGGGCEWYFGYRFPHNDLNCEDWRSRQRMWDQTRLALDFFRRHLPFAEMRHADHLTPAGDDYCFAKYGVVYAIYLPDGGSARLDLLTSPATFKVRWYSPRTGGDLQEGTVPQVKGPGIVDLGQPPEQRHQDWVALVRRQGDVPRHTLTVAGGTGTGAYEVGTAAGVAAAPPTGKAFQRWTGDVDTLEDPRAPRTILIMPPRDVALTAAYGDEPPRPSEPSVVSFTLIDADANRPIPPYDPLRDGAVVDLGKLPTRNLNVRANTRPRTVGSVRFRLGPRIQTENSPPYALAGDREGHYHAWTPSSGKHQLTATPYTEADGGGRKGQGLTVSFRVVEGN